MFQQSKKTAQDNVFAARTHRDDHITEEALIGPIMAKDLLVGNTGNRKVRDQHVKNLARAISLGRWVKNPSPIVKTESGKLLDGQHRLHAVLMSGEPIRSAIVTVPDHAAEEIFQVLDQGTPRNVADALRVDRTVTQPILYLLRSSYKIIKPAPDDVKIFIDSELGDLLIELQDRVKPKGRYFTNPTFRAACIIAILSKKVDKETAFGCYHNLCHLTPSEWHKIFSIFYKQMVETAGGKQNGRSLHNDVFMRALYCFINLDANLSTIRISDGFRNSIVHIVADALRRATDENLAL